MEDDNELLLETPLDDGAEPPEGGELPPEGDDGDIHIEIEGEEAEDETDLVKHLRGVARDAQREAAELRKAQQPQAIEIGKKPDLWDDCEGDPDKFEAAIIAYNGRVQQAQQAEQARTRGDQTQTQAFEKARISYAAKALQMGIKDPDAVVEKVAAELGGPHAGFIIQYLDNGAALMAALDRNPALLAKISAEPDQVKQMVMLAQMEAKVKVTRKGPPPPEAATIQRGSASLSTAVDKVGDALFKKGQQSNDMTEYLAHQRAKRRAAKGA